MTSRQCRTMTEAKCPMSQNRNQIPGINPTHKKMQNLGNKGEEEKTK